MSEKRLRNVVAADHLISILCLLRQTSASGRLLPRQFALCPFAELLKLKNKTRRAELLPLHGFVHVSGIWGRYPGLRVKSKTYRAELLPFAWFCCLSFHFNRKGMTFSVLLLLHPTYSSLCVFLKHCIGPLPSICSVCSPAPGS